MSTEKPLRLIDRSGKELAANRAWRTLAADPEGGLAEALADLARPGRDADIACPMVVSSSGLPLAADFGAAPGGLCDQVEVSALHAPSEPDDGWLA